MNQAEIDALELGGLTDDEKFCKVERHLHQRLIDAKREADRNNSYGGPCTPDFTEYDYAVAVSAAAMEYGQHELAKFDLPWPGEDDCLEKCRMFRALAGQMGTRLLLRHAGRDDPNNVAFDEKTKEKLRFHLRQLREAIKKDAMPQWQKEEWYEAISALEAQIEKSRTALVAFLEVAGKGLKLEMPISECIGTLVAIATEAKFAERARTMLLSLPPQKQIEATKQKSLPSPPPARPAKPKPKGFDDEIPF